MRKIVIITLLIPVILMIGYSIFSRVYSPDAIPADFAFGESEIEITAADGALLAASEIRLRDPGARRPLVIQIAERSLDRDWNSRSFRFRTGERLAAILGGAGFHSLRFDHRGTGDTRASARTRSDLGLMIADISSVTREGRRRLTRASLKLEENAQPAADSGAQLSAQIAPAPPELFYLAHDGGCALSLAAIAKQLQATPDARAPAGVALLACDLSGSYLEQWGRKLLHNMRRQNVDPQIVSRAEAEWNAFVRDGRLPEKEIAATETPPPDLVAFREALRYMASEEMRGFRESAAELVPERSLRVLLRRGVPVLHMLGTMDGELPPAALEAARRTTPQREALGPYRLRIVPSMNHFLKEQEQELQGPGLLLERMSPFRRIQPAAVRILREFFEKYSG